MPKGYWIGHVDIDDPEAYEKYHRANTAAFARYGARFLVCGGRQKTPEYQRAKTLRDPVSRADLVIVEGWRE